MSAMANNTDTPRPPAAKRAKTDSDAPQPRGIGLVIRSEDALALSPGEGAAPTPSVWVMDGDRTRRSPGLWTAWSDAFHGPEPHNIYMVNVDENGQYIPLFVPGNVHKTGEQHTFTVQECGRAMLRHAFSKGWIPKCVLTEAESGPILEYFKANKKDKKILKAHAAQKVDELEDVAVQQFIDLCCDFSTRVMTGDSNGRPYLLTEVVCGAIEQGDLPFETALKEGHEESCAPLPELMSHVRGTGLVEYVTDRGSRWSSTYECRFTKQSMVTWWQTERARRKGLTNWFCAHGWFSSLPGIVEPAMDSLKGKCETCNGRWVSVEEALAILDSKSLNVLKHVLKH
tara:strand:+ start:1792 stop:2817 length:1026 start_codon:yes stop_codon:yes gene_type:complete